MPDPGIYAPSTDKQQSDAGHFVAALTPTTAELNKVDGVGAVIASGTPVTHIADAVTLTGGESPTEADHNALAAKVNLIIDALEAFRIDPGA